MRIVLKGGRLMANARVLTASDVAERFCEEITRGIQQNERSDCAQTPLFSAEKLANYFPVNLIRRRRKTSGLIFFIYDFGSLIALIFYLLRRESRGAFRHGKAVVTYRSRLSQVVPLVCSFIGIIATGAAAQTPYDEIGLASGSRPNCP